MITPCKIKIKRLTGLRAVLILKIQYERFAVEQAGTSVLPLRECMERFETVPYPKQFS
jgi:hypothetical protein